MAQSVSIWLGPFRSLRLPSGLGLAHLCASVIYGALIGLVLLPIRTIRGL